MNAGGGGALLALALLVGALSGGACRRAAGPQEREHHQEHAGEFERHQDQPPTQTGKSGPGVLRVDPQMARDLRLTTTAVESRPGGEGGTALGELEPDQEAYAEVGAPVEGRVVRLHATAGQEVKAGAVLAEIESATLGRARAAAVTARAKADLARQAVERKRRLVAENIAPGRELEEAEAEAKAADAELHGARTTLGAFGAGASQVAEGQGGALLRLRAPIGGTVLERKVARGQVVSPEVTLFRIADLGSLWLTVHAFERDALGVAVGAPVRVTFPALPGRSYAGKVTWVGSEVDTSSRTIPVRVTVPNEDQVLRPGMSASAWLPVGKGGAPVIVVPTAALQRLDRDWVVFVPRKESNSFDIRKVGRGRDLGGEVEILSQLRAGETVVVDGAFLLKAEAEKARGMGERHEH